MRLTKRDKVHVPWLELARVPTKYLDANTIPEGFEVLDPSRLTKIMIGQLWSHWQTREKAKQPTLIFTGARAQDLGLRAGWEKPRVEKRVAYVDVGSDDQSSGDELDGADKGEGTSWSSVRPPPSKRLCLSREKAVQPVLEEESPAANNSDRSKFLHSLSLDPSYKTLLNGVLALPVLVSSFICLFIRTCLILYTRLLLSPLPWPLS